MSTIVTMKTIAAQAGVTQATVSMCLANNPRIPPTTRARIRAVADRLGYRPNPYVSALMRIRRQGKGHHEKPVIALVNGLESAAAWRDTAPPTVRLMREGAIERAALRGYRAQEFWLHQEGMSADRFSGMLHARGIQGLLLGPLAFGAAPPALKWEHFSAVRLGVPLLALTITTVCNDHFFSALQAVRECHKLGYRRPGLVILRSHRERFLGRWDGGLLVGRHLLAGLKPVQTLLLDDWKDLSRVAAWLRREKPDVLVSPSVDELQPHLKRLGWRVPQDLGLASLACPKLDHACSGIWQNGALIGATAMDTLISMLERHERGLPEQAHTFMVEGIWNPGRTLRTI
ncbi:MAG: LacI family transcriptional regulator [Lacunisphaera sp.]|nr:LacI family transcriptional regulator [Lacunisphaera sp.]